MLPKIPELIFVLEKDGVKETFNTTSDLYEYCLDCDDLHAAITEDYYGETFNNKESLDDFMFRYLDSYLADNGYKLTLEKVNE